MEKHSNSGLDFVRSGDGVVDPIQLSRPPIVDVEAARSDFEENEIGNASGESGPLRMEFVPNPEPLAQIDELELNVAGQRASIENIFLDSTILKGLERASSSSDLYSLRQISSKYYNQFNSPYWDSVNIGIAMSKHVCEGCVGDWDLEKFINNKFMGEICGGDWKPEAATMFRQLRFDDVQFFKIQNPETESEDQVKRIVADLRPHITTLQLDFDPFYVLRRRSNQFSAFLSSFLRLKTLIVKGDRYDGGILVTEELTMMELDEFVVILSNLPKKPNIVLYVTMSHHNNAFLSKLYNQPNTQLVLCFNKVQEFKYYHDNFSTLTRVKFSGEIELYKNPDPNEDGEDMEELRDLAQLTLEHGDQMEDLCLELMFHVRLEEEEKARYQESLTQLSPFLTQLAASIDKRYRNFDIVSPGLRFPKLRHLDIDIYRQPLLGILNSCSMLKTLDIESNENFSFFSNHNQSDKKALYEHFRNLTQLERVSLKGWAGQKFARGGVLKKYLKKILPPSCQLYCEDLSE